MWVVLVAFLATIFVVWGVGGKQSESYYAARVNDQIITYNDYRKAYESKANELRTTLGEYAEQIIKDNTFSGIVLENLVNTQLLLLEANRLKIPAGDTEVVEYIRNESAFMTDGVFDPERYMQILSYVGYRSPSIYENEIKDMIKINKLQQLLNNSFSVTDEEIRREHIHTNSKLSASYFSVSDDAYKTDVPPDKAVLEDYYAKNQERYRFAPKIKVKYAAFSIDNFTNKTEITDEAVRERYTAAIADYTDGDSVMPYDEVKDEIRASMEEESKKNAYRNHLYSLYRDILNASNLTAYLVKNPGAFEVQESELLAEDDPFAFFQSDPELKKILFTASKAEITPLIDFQGAAYIYEITERENSKIPSFDAVNNSVEADWFADAAFNAALDDVNAKVNVDNISYGEFKSLAEQFETDVNTIQPFRRNDILPDAPWVKELAFALFKGDEGDILKYPERIGNRIYVLRIEKVIPPPENYTEEEKDFLFQYLLSVKREDAYTAFIKSLRVKHKVTMNPNIINSY
jgi:peptidyl-prolyl cis-trans isomerase D